MDYAAITEFLREYPQMRIRPGNEDVTIIAGTFEFSSTDGNHQVERETYELEILLPPNFPDDLPNVYETGGRIPRDGNHHVNVGDNSLCLGSPLRLKITLSQNPTLLWYADKCIIPYLHAVTQKMRNGGAFAFGELEHGVDGLIADYRDILKVPTARHIVRALTILSRFDLHSAQREECPCGCGRMLKECSYYEHLKTFVPYASKEWYGMQASFFLRAESPLRNRLKWRRKRQSPKNTHKERRGA